MVISIIHPSRSRPAQAFEAFKRWTSLIGEPYEYILSLDIDDDTKFDYFNLFQSTGALITVNTNRSAVDAINRGAEWSKGDILIQISEDFYCFENWGKTVLQAVEGKEDFLLKTDDGTQGWIVTLPIMDRKFYEANGYFYHPGYLHMFVDSDLTHMADIQKKLIIRNDILFEHRHYQTKKTPKDALNEKADKTWTQGQNLYFQRLKEAFGTSCNVWDVSKQASKHIRWVRERLPLYA